MARPRRPAAGEALAAFSVVLLAVTAWIGVQALLAQRHLTAARTDLTTARDALQERDVVTARAAIAAAGSRASRARALTDDVVWRLAAGVPGYGSTAESVTGLARAADQLANRVLPLALDGADVLDPERLRRPDGVVDVELVRTAAAPVEASAIAAARVRDDVRDLPESTVLLVADAQRQLSTQAADLADALRSASDALTVAPALLGADRPRRYLLLIQQTGESRGTGGIVGGYVELVADAGRLTAVRSASRTDLDGGTVAPPPGVPQDYVDLYEDEGAFRFWVNVNLSPDLPVVARVAASRWRAQGREPLDGVGFLDAKALSLLLQGSGPVPLPDGGTLAPEDIEQYLAVEQYRGVPLTSAGALTRKDRLDDIAALTAARLTAGGGDSLSLLRGMTAALRSGHLRFASDDPALQPALGRVDGALPKGEAPFTYPVLYNSTGGKLDHYLERSVSYSAEGCDGPRRRSTVSVTLTNTAPEDLPPYLTIRILGDEVGASRTNAVTLQVYGTRGADLVRATLDGRPVRPEDPAGPLLANASEAGLPLWYLGLELPPGQPRTLVLELDEPVTAGAARIVEQPLARPLQGVLDVPECLVD